MAGRHIELREIDYAEVLRERAGGEAGGWETSSPTASRASAFDLDEDAMRELLGIAGDATRLGELMASLERGATRQAASASRRRRR